ncbi:MAG: hypothetical protein AAGA56_20080 [Myxococcota bacterium]
MSDRFGLPSLAMMLGFALVLLTAPAKALTVPPGGDIQLAINQIHPGGVIHLAGSHYSVSDIIEIDKDVGIVGLPSGTQIDFSSISYFLVENGASAGFENLDISSEWFSSIYNSYGGLVTVRDCSITGLGNRAAIRSYRSLELRVQNTIFQDAGFESLLTDVTRVNDVEIRNTGNSIYFFRIEGGRNSSSLPTAFVNRMTADELWSFEMENVEATIENVAVRSIFNADLVNGEFTVRNSTFMSGAGDGSVFSVELSNITNSLISNSLLLPSTRMRNANPTMIETYSESCDPFSSCPGLQFQPLGNLVDPGTLEPMGHSIDGGDPAACTAAGPRDAQGNNRFVGPSCDLGGLEGGYVLRPVYEVDSELEFPSDLAEVLAQPERPRLNLLCDPEAIVWPSERNCLCRRGEDLVWVGTPGCEVCDRGECGVSQ